MKKLVFKIRSEHFPDKTEQHITKHLSLTSIDDHPHIIYRCGGNKCLILGISDQESVPEQVGAADTDIWDNVWLGKFLSNDDNKTNLVIKGYVILTF
jgi:hypothetical protein